MRMPAAAKTLLIVEDDHDTRVSLRWILEREGYLVLSAADGRQAMSLLKGIEPPAVILLDMMMPLMDGNEFLTQLLREERLKHIPVIIVSAFPQVVRRGTATDFLRKPVDLDQLIETIKFRAAFPPYPRKNLPASFPDGR
jgi:CheY-like chemotaxis protein